MQARPNQDPFSSIFGGSAFGGMSQQMNGNITQSLFTQSQSQSSGRRGFSQSTSTSTTIQNGIRTTVKTSTDSSGNTSVETTIDDGHGRVSRSIRN